MAWASQLRGKLGQATPAGSYTHRSAMIVCATFTKSNEFGFEIHMRDRINKKNTPFKHAFEMWTCGRTIYSTPIERYL